MKSDPDLAYPESFYYGFRVVCRGMTMRDDEMEEPVLLPVSLLDLIPEDHICHFVADMVNNMASRETEKIHYRAT
jgi:hypothetical protein